MTKDIPSGSQFVSGDTAPTVRTKLNDNVAWTERELQGIEDRLEDAGTEVVGSGVIGGLAVSAGSGLSVDVASGRAIIGFVVRKPSPTYGVAVTASTLNYVYLLQDGTVVTDVTGVAPTSQASILLATAQAGSSSVTSVDNDPAGKQKVGLLAGLGTGAGIAATVLEESKVGFDAVSGHDHDGAGSRPITKTTSNTLTVGDGLATDKTIRAAAGSTPYPGIRFEATARKWQYSNDGSAWNEVGTGGGTGTPSDTVTAETAYGAAPSSGVAGAYSRGDHTHGTPPLGTNVPPAVEAGGSGSAGTAVVPARNDHAHAAVTGVPGAIGSTSAAEGTSAALARADHTHAAFEGIVPQNVSGTAATGVSDRAARSDHVHEGLHSIAAQGEAQVKGDATLIAGANVTLTQSGSGITVAATSAGGVPSNSVQSETGYGQGASAGSATTYARGDHTHGTPSLGSAAPQPVGDAAATGTATVPSRQDHAHEGVHALKVTGASGELRGNVYLTGGSNVRLERGDGSVTVHALDPLDGVATIGASFAREARTDIVECAGYEPLPTADNLFGDLGTSSCAMLMAHPRSRIRQTGNLTKARFFVKSVPSQLTAVYVDIWRKLGPDDGTTGYSFRRVHHVSVLSQLQANQVNEITFFSPLPAVSGDYVGISWTESGTPAQWLRYTAPDPAFASACHYVTDADPDPTGYPWQTKATWGNYLCIKLFMQAPLFVGTGDSLLSAYAGYSFVSAVGADAKDQECSPLFHISRALGRATYQNMTVTGSTTSWIAGQFAADVVALKPRFVVVDGGTNDIAGASDTDSAQATARATALANYTSMLGLCQANGIVPVVLLIPPRGNSASGTRRMRSRDTLNAALRSLVESYGGIAADASSYVGRSRTVQLLSQPDFASHDLWSVTGDWNDSGGNAAYAHSSGSGDLTQTSANMQEALVGGELYKLTYTVASPSGDAKATVKNSGGPATVDSDLTMTSGLHSTFFTAKATPGDFVIHGSSTSGGFALDDLVLEKVGEPANYWDIRAELDNGDQLHFNTDGYRRIAEAIIAELATFRVLGEVGCGQLRTEGPIRFTGARGPRSVEVERTPDTSRAGADLLIRAGGAAVDSADRAGGTLTLSGGVATGSGNSAVNLAIALPGASGYGTVVPTTALAVNATSIQLYSALRLDRADGHLHFWDGSGWTNGLYCLSSSSIQTTSGFTVNGLLTAQGSSPHYLSRTSTSTGSIEMSARCRKALTSGTAAAGIGAYMGFETKDASGNYDFAGHVGARFAVVTHGSEIGELVLSPDRASANALSVTRAVLIRADAGDANIAHLSMPGDNAKHLFGAGEDASIYYDGTNMKINPKEVGTGILDVLGTLKAAGYQSSDGSAGWTGTFTEHTGKTVTVKNGLVTACA